MTGRGTRNRRTPRGPGPAGLPAGLRTAGLVTAGLLAAGLALVTPPTAAAEVPVVPALAIERRALPRLPGAGGESVAHAVNAWGTAAGTAVTAQGAWHAVVWRDGRAVDLGVLEGDARSAGYAINDRGMVAGDSGGPAAFLPRAAVLWRAGRAVELPRPADPTPFEYFIACSARGVDPTGDLVVGSCLLDINNSIVDIPVLWRRGVPTTLPDRGSVLAVNPSHVLVGTTTLDWDGSTAAARWDGDEAVPAAQPLPALPGGDLDSAARDVSDVGLVVGTSACRAAVWTSSGVRALPRAADTDCAGAFGVNRWGRVVGTSGGRATLWWRGSLVDLGAPGTARAMTDTGRVVGDTTDASGRSVATWWRVRQAAAG